MPALFSIILNTFFISITLFYLRFNNIRAVMLITKFQMKKRLLSVYETEVNIIFQQVKSSNKAIPATKKLETAYGLFI